MSDWVRWMQQLQAIAQTGLHFTENPFDKERYGKLLDIALEIGATHTNLPADDLRTLHLRQRGYATPRVDVRSACFRENRILLVKERTDGRWALPGGWADVGEKPARAAEREVVEESGYEARAVRLIGVFDNNRGGRELSLYHAYKLIFFCEVGQRGNFTDSAEILDVGFFGEHELPLLSLNRTWPDLITECFAHLRDPRRAAYFE